MNANEVIADRALELTGKNRGGKDIHPNDHVNMGNRVTMSSHRYSHSCA